jgi:hypothetical protein
MIRAREKNGRTMPSSSFPPEVQALLDLVAEVILDRLIKAESADIAQTSRRNRP